MVTVRRAIAADRDRIVAISSQIWDGNDYVPELVDGWLTDDGGELAVATLKGDVIAFAHRTWLIPGVAWFEGIRTDPACQRRGAGKALTEYLIRAARDAGAAEIHLSTYIDNEASIHIIESYGFQLAATFSCLERPRDLPLPEASDKPCRIRTISETEAVQFIGKSEFLALSQHQFSHGWKFFPFDRDPSGAIANHACRLGCREHDAWRAVLCIRQSPSHDGPVTLSFLDGEPVAMQSLLQHALRLYAGRAIEVMVPVHQEHYAALFPLLRETGFTSWSGFKPDVFVYELPL